jgi:hypothetical protein
VIRTVRTTGFGVGFGVGVAFGVAFGVGGGVACGLAVAMGLSEIGAEASGSVGVSALAIDVASSDVPLVGLPSAVLGWPGVKEPDGVVRVATLPRARTSATAIVIFWRREAARQAAPILIGAPPALSFVTPAIERVKLSPAPVLEV